MTRLTTNSDATGAGQVLLVDDDADARDLLAAALEQRGFHVTTADSAERALELLDDEVEVVLSDVRLGAMDGIALCQEIARIDDNLPVVVITAFGETSVAVAAIRARAEDFVCKPVDIDHLVIALERAVRDRRLHRKVRQLSKVVEDAFRDRKLLGKSSEMRRLRDLIEQIAPSTATALIVGETGTGKELVARAIHDQSGRTGPFVAINCAAIPAELLESELFGHVKGAFTDANSSRQGLFCQADGGTVFLDEIGEMPPETQVKLLRVLQERKLRPVGGDEEISFDTRIIAATNRDLSEAVERGSFREDLFYRINIVPIQLPPLRERGDDVLLLAQAFLERAARRTGKDVRGISVAVASKLRAYDWPGNVRELENTIERAVAFTYFQELVTDDLPDRIRDHGRADWSIAWAASTDELPPLADVEAQHVQRVLAAVDNNKTRAAKLLGIDRRTLYRHLRRHELNQQDDPESDRAPTGAPRTAQA